MAFQYISWRELRPANDLRFDEWEKSWKVEAATGKHIIWVYVDYPWELIPAFRLARKAGVKETAYEEYGGGKSPDYDDPRMVAGLERLIAAWASGTTPIPASHLSRWACLGFGASGAHPLVQNSTLRQKRSGG